ncbi:Ku DNA-binding complex Ku70 subunit, partial [Amylostereum chailletii]
MAPYDDWNKLDEEEEEELQDASAYESKRDVILFCIDCSPSMLELHEDPRYEDVQTCHLLTALEASIQIQKRKVVVGPNDSVGIVFFNTTRRNEPGEGTELKNGTYVYQHISTINAPQILDLTQLMEEARENVGLLRESYPPTDKKMPMGDVFTSCNWVMRDGAPKAASKRVFLITDDDNPHSGPGSDRLIMSARTTLVDLVQAGITVEPFFISTDDKPFDRTKFWVNVLLPTSTDPDADANADSTLPDSFSITRIDDLLEQMRFHEVPKRALFSIPFTLAEGFIIGVKGYGLVTEQKKGAYRYFVDLGDRMEVAESRTVYVDEGREAEVNKNDMLFGMTLGATADDDDSVDHGFGARAVRPGERVFYTAEEVKSFRTLGLEPGIKLLGFKDRSDLAFEDNVKHSQFIYPDEMAYAGSKRTFSALLKSMLKKDKLALVRAMMRSNSTPTFCAMLPQAERFDDAGWSEPAGFHLIPLPFADDIRAAPIEEAFRAGEDLVDAVRPFVKKLSLKNAYEPESYPNPALAFHNEQLEASAFREEYDPEAFEDLTLPKYAAIHKKIGPMIREWKRLVREDDSANAIIAAVGSKRK